MNYYCWNETVYGHDVYIVLHYYFNSSNDDSYIYSVLVDFNLNLIWCYYDVDAIEDYYFNLDRSYFGISTHNEKNVYTCWNDIF